MRRGTLEYMLQSAESSTTVEDSNTAPSPSPAISLVDKAIAQISGQQLVSSAEMTDLLLDIRLYLMTESQTADNNR
jgi:hypothetical protein